MENLYHHNCIRTYSGKYVNPFDMKITNIEIVDIIHALSNICRWGGHVHDFYSVGEHSIRCHWLVTPKDRLAALLHDASEAYLCDIPKPLKKNLIGYEEAEDRLMRLIAEKFQFQYPLPDAVKFADKTMLEREWHCLVIKDEQQDKMLVNYTSPQHVRERFRELYQRLERKEHFIPIIK